MRTLARVFTAVTFCIMASPAHAQQPSFHYPRDGNDLLDFCGLALNRIDSPGQALQPLWETKEGWCVGHIQTMREMIIFWQVQYAKAIIVLTDGDTDPSTEKLTALISKSSELTCFPNGVGLPQMIRILVKWLHDHPERLHEPVSILTGDAFQSAFPCHADEKKSATP